MSMVDPYSVARLWVGDVLKGDATTAYEAMRKVIAVAEEIDFLREGEI